MSTRLTLLSFTAALTVASCSSVPYRTPEAVSAPIVACSVLEADTTREVSTRLGTRCAYHEVLRAPERFLNKGSAIARNEGVDTLVLVGLEKPRRMRFPYHMTQAPEDSSNRPIFDASKVADFPSKAAAEIIDVLDDDRPSLLTHTVEFRHSSAGWSSICADFSMYSTRAPQCSIESSTAGLQTSDFAAWAAMDRLGARIGTLVEQEAPTHIVVMSTGWNTPQAESIENYRWWIERIAEADDNRGLVKPLYVGIAWESTWNWMPKALSVLTKGNDADEIGLTWINYLVNVVIGPVAAAHHIPVAVVGHSYGTRVVGSSVFVPDLLAGNGRIVSSPALFIGLQGAFPLGRFARCEDRVKEPLWARARPPRTRVVLTTSIYDSATSTFLAHDYVGGNQAIAARKRLRDLPECALEWLGLGELDATGNLIAPSRAASALVDAKAVVHRRQPNTGGGAHSDVFTVEIGNLIWSELRALSPRHAEAGPTSIK